jgi:hypothetical protein
MYGDYRAGQTAHALSAHILREGRAKLLVLRFVCDGRMIAAGSMCGGRASGNARRSCGRSKSRRAQPASVSGAEGTRIRTRPIPSSIAALNSHPGEIRLGRFRNFDRADVRENVLCEVVRHVVGQRRQRLIFVGTLDRNVEAPGVQ